MNFKRCLPLFVFPIAMLAPKSEAQVSFSGSYQQNFDTLASSPTSTDLAFSNNSTLAGWYFENSPLTARGSLYRVSAGSDNTGSLYSFGASNSSERALGSIGSNAFGNAYYGVRLVNSTAFTLSNVTLSYTGEEWRNGGNTTAQSLIFAYGLGATGIQTGNYINVAGLNFTSPVATATAGALDGNLPANRVSLTSTITGLNWAPQTELWLRWFDANDAGNDHGLAIDNLSVTATPEPAIGMISLAALLAGGFALRSKRRRK